MRHVDGYTVLLSGEDLQLAAAATRELLELASLAQRGEVNQLRERAARLARSRPLLDLAQDLRAHATRSCSSPGTPELARTGSPTQFGCSTPGTPEDSVGRDVSPSGHDDEPHLTAADAAHRLGVSASLVRRWCRDGRLAGAVKDAHRGWTIPESTVAEARLDRHDQEHDDVA